MRRRLWVVALVVAVVGVASLVETPPIGALGVAAVIVPYVAVVGITAWAGRQHTGAAVLGVIGAVVMTTLSWWDATHRQTEGADPEFGNALGFAVCCGANYCVLFVLADVGVLALILVRLFTPPKPG